MNEHPVRNLPLRDTAVVITRPVGRGAALAARVRRLGAVPVLWPTASLRASADPHAARHQLDTARAASAVIFTSVAAVRFAFALRPDWRPGRRSSVIAVGPSTAAALRRHGLAVEQPAARFDSEGVLALPVLRDVAGKTVAIVCAPDGRSTMQEQLRQAGANVEQVQVYRRTLPRWSSRQHLALATAPARRIVLLSSVEALRALPLLLDATTWKQIRAARWVVSSERVAEAARLAGVRHLRVARSALPADLLAAAMAGGGPQRR